MIWELAHTFDLSNRKHTAAMETLKAVFFGPDPKKQVSTVYLLTQTEADSPETKMQVAAQRSVTKSQPGYRAIDAIREQGASIHHSDLEASTEKSVSGEASCQRYKKVRNGNGQNTKAVYSSHNKQSSTRERQDADR